MTYLIRGVRPYGEQVTDLWIEGGRISELRLG